MINEINIAIGGAAAALLSGLVGVATSWYDQRHERRQIKDVRQELAWREHRSEDLARNLLVLEMIADGVECRPMDVAIRARLTPTELRKTLHELNEASLIEAPSSNLVRLTEDGHKVLASHRIELEDSGLHRSQRQRDVQRGGQSPDELDNAIEAAVANLRTQHAH